MHGTVMRVLLVLALSIGGVALVAQQPVQAQTAAACADGVDNDGDGLVDYPADAGCSSPADTDELPPPACSDGLDNDADGKVDFPTDDGCSDANDNDEEPLPGPPGSPCPGCICNADLDGDGAADGPTETADCGAFTDGALCPLQQTACVIRSGVRTCPTDPGAPCIDTGGGTYQCSANRCFVRGTGSSGTDIDQPLPSDDGPRDAAGHCLGILKVFSGQGKRCRKSGTQTAFQDCCQNDRPKLNDTMGEKGGKSQRDYKKEATFVEFWKNQCDIQDQETAQLADSNYCIDLGTFCAESWFGTCVQKSQSYCCFSSLLAKLIQEQGRPQLPSKGGFGSPEDPNCDGFTMEEFQALDLSKIDLSSYYGEFRFQSGAAMQTPMQDNVHGYTGR